MRLLTFDQFFAEPEGVLFSFDHGAYSRFGMGLYRKGKSWPEDDEEPACVTMYNIHTFGLDTRSVAGDSAESIEADDLDGEAYIALYEADDLAKLAGWVDDAVWLASQVHL